MMVRVGSLNHWITLQPKAIRHQRPHASAVTPDTPIWCPACQQEHPVSAFNLESRKYSGLHGICREAQRLARQTPTGKEATVRRNLRRWADPGYRAKSLAWAQQRRQRLGATHDLRRARKRLQSIVIEWKSKGCVDCRYDDVRAIEPDHLEGHEKVDNISRMVTMCASSARIRQELAKCEPRCTRCHRRITAERRISDWRSAPKLPPSWQRRLDHQDYNDKLKLIFGCLDCGWREWARGLDWDHVDGNKISDISKLIANGRPWAEVAREIAKCDCVCANCHRIRTIERLRAL